MLGAFAFKNRRFLLIAVTDFFLKNMQGEFFITDPRPAVVDDTKSVMLFTSPIYTNGKIVVSVIYSYLCDDMEDIFNLEFLDKAGRMLVTKAEGTALIGNMDGQRMEENLLAYLHEKCTHAGHTPQTCITLVGEEGSFVFSPKDNSSDLYLQYNRLPYNDWYLVSMAPEHVAAKTIATVATDQRNMGLAMAFCVLAYFSVLSLFWVMGRRNVDKMTGALTLESFKSKAAGVLHRTHKKEFVFVKFDVKSFKLINRVYNFDIGNLVIRNIANALRATVVHEQDACVARVGTDDFLLLLPYSSRERLQEQRGKFINEFHKRMGAEFTTAVEFPTGQYVLRPEDFPRPDIMGILEKVNFAHRASKRKQAITVVDYEEDIEREALVEKSIEDRMVGALSNGEFRLYLQPKYKVDDTTLCGAEALVRWKAGARFLMPSDFVPILERMIELVDELHAEGFLVSMDDFGSGYSCLAQLKELDVDILKLDRGFFTGKADIGRARVVVSSMLEMAQKLHIKTVAEGIETQEQVDMLRSLGCDIIQGYYYGKPMPAELLETVDGLPLEAQSRNPLT